MFLVRDLFNFFLVMVNNVFFKARTFEDELISVSSMGVKISPIWLSFVMAATTNNVGVRIL